MKNRRIILIVCLFIIGCFTIYNELNTYNKLHKGLYIVSLETNKNYGVLKTNYIWKDLNEVHNFMSLFKQIHNSFISMDYFATLINNEDVCKVDSYKYKVVKIFSNNKYAIYQIK